MGADQLRYIVAQAATSATLKAIRGMHVGVDFFFKLPSLLFDVVVDLVYNI